MISRILWGATDHLNWNIETFPHCRSSTSPRGEKDVRRRVLRYDVWRHFFCDFQLISMEKDVEEYKNFRPDDPGRKTKAMLQ
jgi:hypothetical protein